MVKGIKEEKKGKRKRKIKREEEKGERTFKTNKIK